VIYGLLNCGLDNNDLEWPLKVISGILQYISKNRIATMMSLLHQFTTFTNYFWHRDTLFNSPLTVIKFLNWLRTSCVVSITTVATWHTWTSDFSADFERRRQGNKRVAKRLWGRVNADTRHSNTCCNCSYLGRKYTGYAANLVPPISERFHTYHVGECLKNRLWRNRPHPGILGLKTNSDR